MLLDTLTALWEAEGHVGRAGGLLAVTEKARRYRLAKVTELTGLDPFKPADRMRLDLARHGLALYPAA